MFTNKQQIVGGVADPSGAWKSRAQIETVVFRMSNDYHQQMCIYIYIYIYICVYTCVHIYIYIYIYIHR